MFQKSLETAGHRPAQTQEEPAGWGRVSRFLSRVTEFVCKLFAKLLNSRVLSSGFVMECAKKVLVLSIYKKVVEKSAV